MCFLAVIVQIRSSENNSNVTECVDHGRIVAPESRRRSFLLQTLTDCLGRIFVSVAWRVVRLPAMEPSFR